MKKFLKDNRGLSLIELIVVSAIMVVLASTTAFSIRMVSNRAASQCAENMKISLEKHRTSVMGKKNGRIAFFTDGSGNVYMQEEFDYSGAFSIDMTKATRIGRNNVDVTCGGVTLSTSPVIFEFNRSGALKDGISNTPVVIKRNNRVYTLTIEPLTGKITLK